MKFHLNRFLRRVRIHGGEFDTSARAMYREGVTSSLRADLRIVRGSTIERKQMSTKTTIKRLALVTVAALGLGVLTVAPSSAAPQADSLTLAATKATATVGTAASVNVTLAFSQETSSDTMTLTLGYVSAPAGFGTGEVMFTNPATAVTTDLPAGVTTDTNTASARVAKISAPTTAYVNKTLAVTLTPTKAGVYVIRVTPADGAATPAAISSVAQTITFTVSAKTVGKSSAFIGSSPTATATADATIAVTSAASTTAIGRIDVASIYGTTGNETASAADAPSVVVATTKGLVSATNAYVSGLKSVTTAAGTDADPSYWVFSNGDVGAASITITVGGVLLATKTLTFKGPATTLVATATGATGFTGVGAGKTTTLTITATDSAAGAAISIPASKTAVSSDTSVATVAVGGSNDEWVVTGVKAGTATITITDPAATTPAAAAKYAVTVKANKPTTAPTITFDKPSYNVGDIIEMTVNADMADSATAQLFTAALVSSAAVTTVPGATALPSAAGAAGGQHAIVSGKATYKFYAPSVSGSFTITGTGGSDIDLTTLVTAPVVTGTVAIDNPAVAAAELAEAAAQDATDAALEASEDAKLAVELAQQAVDAVADLSAQVTTLIAALKKQITTLTTLVKKIAAKK